MPCDLLLRKQAVVRMDSCSRSTHPPEAGAPPDGPPTRALERAARELGDWVPGAVVQWRSIDVLKDCNGDGAVVEGVFSVVEEGTLACATVRESHQWGPVRVEASGPWDERRLL